MRTLDSYRQNVANLLVEALAGHGPASNALDVGAGEGWFAAHLEDRGVVRRVVPLEVQLRPRSLRKPVLFDGRRLPFADRSFDLVFAIDVLHHADDPRMVLNEMARCASRLLLVKDHTYETFLGRWLLTLLDQAGNRRFGIPSPGHYQRGWAWMDIPQQYGFELERRIHPATCQRGLLGATTNGVQFVALWSRRTSTDHA